MSSLQTNGWYGVQTSRRLPSLTTSIPIPRVIRKPSPSRSPTLNVSKPSLHVPTMSPSSSPSSQRRASILRPRPTLRATCPSPTRTISSASNNKPTKSRSVNDQSAVIRANAPIVPPTAKQLAKYFAIDNQQQKFRLLAELCAWLQRDGHEAYSSVVQLLNQFQFLYSSTCESYIYILVTELSLIFTQSSDQYAATIVDLFNYLIQLAPNQRQKMLLHVQLNELGFESIAHNILAKPRSSSVLVKSITRYNEMLLADLRQCFAHLEGDLSQSGSHLFSLMCLLFGKLSASSLDEPNKVILIKLLQKITTFLWPGRVSNGSQIHATHLLKLIDRYFELLTTEQNTSSPIELGKMLDNLLLELEMPYKNNKTMSNDNKCTAAFDQNADSSFSSISSLSLLTSSPSSSLSSLENVSVFSKNESAICQHIPNDSTAVTVSNNTVLVSPPSLSMPPPPPPPPPPMTSFSMKSSSIKPKESVQNHCKKFPDTPSSSQSPNSTSDDGIECLTGAVDILHKKPKTKMKTINWTKISTNAIGPVSADKQLNIWQLIGQKLSKETVLCEQSDSGQLVDFEQLEELFCLPSAPMSNVSSNFSNGNANSQLQLSTANSCPNSPQIVRRSSCAGPSTSFDQSSDGSLSLDYISMGHFNELTESVSPASDFSSLSLRSNVEPQVAFLDSKRTLSVNIFLKQYRGTTLEEIVDLIKWDRHADLGLEKLRSLKSLLPTEGEIALLQKHATEVNRMPLAERFLCILIGMRHYRLKIEFMLLRQEFDANMPALERAVSCVRKAAYELIGSEKLQEILTLVLISGNFLNFGSYAGDAIGFKIMSLSKLTEIRSNKAGLTMVHYVAMQAEKRGLTNFSEDLPNLKEASKISIENLKVEVSSLSDKIANIKLQIARQKKQDDQLFGTISEFLKESNQCIERLKEETEKDIELLRQKVGKFFCEDVAQFKLEECLRIFVIFEQRFKIAVEDNRKRIEHQQKIKTRQLNMSSVPGKIAKNASLNSNACQINSQLTPPTEPFKLMSRSLESSNGGSSLERTASLNRRRSRPNSQDVSDLHSNLVEFLTNSSGLETPNIDGNLFGSNFRRVGSGRRSSRSLANSTSSTIPEDARERLADEDELLQKSSDEPELVSTKFNRFSPFRRTLNYKSGCGTDVKCSKTNKTLQSNEQTSPGEDVLDSKVPTESTPIPIITVSSDPDDFIQLETSNRAFLEQKRQIEAPKQLPIISNLRKSTSQYTQQLTAIISPTKSFIESNDVLHQQFGNAFGNASTDVNIIVSTVTKERPTALSNALPPITIRRTPSFVMGADGKSPVNAAIVMPMQKVEQPGSMATNGKPSHLTEVGHEQMQTTNHSANKKSRIEKRVSQPKASSLSSLPPRDPSPLKNKSSIPVPSKNVTSSSRAKGSISFRQQSAVNKRIAWARHSSQNSTTAPRIPASNGKSYRTPSSISRTSFNSDMGSMLSLQRASQLGTLSSSKSLDSGSSIPLPSAKSFMKPTSSSVAKSRLPM